MATFMILTDRMYDSIDSVLSRADVPETFKNELRGYEKLRRKENLEEEPVIPFSTLRNLQKYLVKKDGKPTLYLHELLEGSEVFFPPLPKPQRNPELLARLERLKAEQENKEYKEMTRSVNADIFGKSPLAQVGQEVRSVQVQLMGILNILLTVVGAFVFGFMAMYYSGQSVNARVLCGFSLAMIVAVADLYFFIKTEI
ncbi:transmembrane protein 199-like [Asterias amurensis]|uniref:transmembrane protein 199-like n=1 Tax=Asterias amurensis TaxID=7602 RepID=UPI003AB52BB3